jgi:hypothetical protein
MQLKSIKGISADSEQLFFEHLIWLSEANRKASKNSTFSEFIDLIVGELSFGEKYVLERRSIFSGTDSFREIQAGLKAEYGMTITAEMCRRYLLSAQKKIEKSISGPGSSRVLEAFGEIDSFLTVERSLLDVENEFHFQAKGSYPEPECTCEFCEKNGRFSMHIYSSVREFVKFRDDRYFIDGYGWEQLKLQLFAKGGVVELKELAVFCEGKNIHQHKFLENLLKRGVLQIGNFMVDPIPMVNVMEAVLKVEKRPISIGECVEKYGVQKNLRSFRNAVASDERFIRVSKDEFAFAGDEYEVYEGIAREMEKVLQKSGRMLLSGLQSELKSKKNINPTSVLFFSSAPIFCVENGFISIRGSSNMLREFPREVDGESWIIASGEIELRFLCDKELLRGSGMSIGAGTAALLGVQPGAHKTYLLGEHEIEVSWSVYSMNPRISSLRNIAIALNAERSNVLRLRFYEVSSSATGRVTTS